VRGVPADGLQDGREFGECGRDADGDHADDGAAERQGVHRGTLGPSLGAADLVFLYQPEDLAWDLEAVAGEVGGHAAVCHAVEELVEALRDAARPGDHILIMSNGAFGGIHERLLQALAE